MYNLTNNKQRNLITSCSCSHFAMYRYYWYLFSCFYRITAFSHSLSHSFILFLSLFRTSFHSYQPIISQYTLFFACILQKEKKETKKKSNERTYRHLSSPSLRNCNLCSFAITHRSDLGGTASVRSGRSLLDG